MALFDHYRGSEEEGFYDPADIDDAIDAGDLKVVLGSGGNTVYDRNGREYDRRDGKPKGC